MKQIKLDDIKGLRKLQGIAKSHIETEWFSVDVLLMDIEDEQYALCHRHDRFKGYSFSMYLLEKCRIPKLEKSLTIKISCNKQLCFDIRRCYNESIIEDDAELFRVEYKSGDNRFGVINDFLYRSDYRNNFLLSIPEVEYDFKERGIVLPCHTIQKMFL